MPAKFDSVLINCSQCGGVAGYKCYNKISGDDYPELKASVLDGSLFVATCVKCKKEIHVTQTLRYSDYSPEKHFFAYLCPKENLVESYQLIQTLPLLRENGTRVHVVSTVSELQQIIISYDYGLSPSETHIDQSVDAARQAEALNRQIGDFFSAMERGELSLGLRVIAESKKKKLPWYKRWFG